MDKNELFKELKMGSSREIFQQIKHEIEFTTSSKEKDSHYGLVGGTLVRISDHCAGMKLWEDYLIRHPEDRQKPILSIVFEDGDSTYSTECLYTAHKETPPIRIREFIYKTPLDKPQVNAIISSLDAVRYGYRFNDPLNLAEKHIRVSVFPDSGNNNTESQGEDDSISSPQDNVTLNELEERLTRLESKVELIKDFLEGIGTNLLKSHNK